MSKKKVLVCGGSGFIGRNLIERLSQLDNLDITATYFSSKPVEINNVKMTYSDLNNVDYVNKIVEGKDIVIQMAATTSGAKDIINKPYIHVADNAVMNSLLLRSAFDNSIEHFIFPSCTVMYPNRDLPLKEEDFNGNEEINPKYFGVGNTKVYLEKMCQFYSKFGKTKHTVIRHSNIYGPYDKFDLEHSHVFGATITKVMTAKDEKVTVWGNGEEKRDFLYISDLMDFIVSVINKQKTFYELYNVGSGKAVSVKELVKSVVKESNKKIKIEYDLSKPTIKTNLCLNCDKAKKEIGWEQKTSLEDGIRKTIEWYRENNKIS